MALSSLHVVSMTLVQVCSLQARALAAEERALAAEERALAAEEQSMSLSAELSSAQDRFRD